MNDTNIRIAVGGVYRHRDNPTYGYAKVLEIIPARTGVNKTARKIVKVHWATDDNFDFALVKYFKQSDMTKDATQ